MFNTILGDVLIQGQGIVFAQGYSISGLWTKSGGLSGPIKPNNLPTEQCQYVEKLY